MNDLALEIKKLAEKYRNSQQHISSSNNSDYLQNDDGNFSENYFEDFDDQKLDLLEDEIANLNQPGEDVLEDNSDEAEAADEIQISDFINPRLNIAEDSGYESQSDIAEQELEFDREEKSAINSNIRSIAKNLRDLKVLLRENI